MEHKEYIRIIPGSRCAVLMIHGITGTPAHFQGLLPVIPEDWSVYNILLDGHGKTARDFGASSMKKWKTQVHNQLEKLSEEYDRVLLVGHSMGTLLSVDAAIHRPERVAGLFLLAVPSRPRVKAATVSAFWRINRGNIQPDDKLALAISADTSIPPDKNLTHYVRWIPRLIELLRECRRVRKKLLRLDAPCQAFQSQADELVSIRSCKDLRGNPNIQTTILYDSGHFAYEPNDLQILQQSFRAMLDDCADNS